MATTMKAAEKYSSLIIPFLDDYTKSKQKWIVEIDQTIPK